MGYPGSTDRYLTSYGVEMAVKKDQPTRVKIRGEKLDIMKRHMNKSDEVRLQYASTYAQVSNYWKYFIGQSEQLQKNGVLQKKREIETTFKNWINEEPDARHKYQDVLYDIEESYKVIEKYNPTTVFFTEAVYSVGLNRFMISHYRLLKLLTQESIDEEAVNALAEKIAPTAEAFFEEFDYDTEVSLIGEMLKMYYTDVPEDQRPQLLDSIGKGVEDWSKFAADNLKNSVFTDKNRYEEFIKNPTKSALETDEIFMLDCDMLDNFRNIAYGPEVRKARGRLSTANRLFIEAMRQMYPNKKKHGILTM